MRHIAVNDPTEKAFIIGVEVVDDAEVQTESTAQYTITI